MPELSKVGITEVKQIRKSGKVHFFRPEHFYISYFLTLKKPNFQIEMSKFNDFSVCRSGNEIFRGTKTSD